MNLVWFGTSAMVTSSLPGGIKKLSMQEGRVIDYIETI